MNHCFVKMKSACYLLNDSGETGAEMSFPNRIAVVIHYQANTTEDSKIRQKGDDTRRGDIIGISRRS